MPYMPGLVATFDRRVSPNTLIEASRLRPLATMAWQLSVTGQAMVMRRLVI